MVFVCFFASVIDIAALKSGDTSVTPLAAGVADKLRDAVAKYGEILTPTSTDGTVHYTINMPEPRTRRGVRIALSTRGDMMWGAAMPAPLEQAGLGERVAV